MGAIPYGRWPSELSPEVVASGRVSWSGLQVEPGWCWWSLSRPADGGRQVVLRVPLGPDGFPAGDAPDEVTAPSMSVRSRVHEYGGAAFFAEDSGALLAVDATGQALWRVTPGVAAERLTPPAPVGEAHRYADSRPLPGSSWVVALRERHRPGAVDDELVALDTRPGASRDVSVLASGRDFYAAPRPSPDGRRLAYLAWDLPAMPWDGCELLVADIDAPEGVPTLTAARRVAGGAAVSVGQPLWTPGGDLWFVSDEAGWWQPYRLTSGGTAVRMVAMEAEFHGPDWALGQSTMALLDDGRLACRYRSAGQDRIGLLDPETGGFDELVQPCVTVGAVAAAGETLLVVGSTPVEPTGLWSLRCPPRPAPGAAPAGRRDDPAQAALVYREGPPPLPPEAVSRAEPVVVDVAHGVRITVLFYPPCSPGAAGPTGTLPPLMVMCHGGPTGANEASYDPAVQFWTSRGVAVAAVDYRGSTGYGRRFRQMLDGVWGVADADDCAAAARHLAAVGLVDGTRMAIKGASAGGLTALRAAVPGGPFAAAVVAYGVTDLAALASETHKFEAGYLDSLVGPWPASSDLYAQRSPARHPERIGAAVLLLQGEDDAVVPPGQAEALVAALSGRGVPCRLLVFPGEGHGFRRADTLAAAWQAELEFVGEVLGFGG